MNTSKPHDLLNHRTVVNSFKHGRFPVIGACSSSMGRVLLAVVLVSGITAVLMAINCWPNLSKQMATTAYREAAGEIVDHRLVRRTSSFSKIHRVYTNHFITFQYVVNGKLYRSDKVRFTSPANLPFYTHEFRMHNYAVGRTVTVFHDPATPTEAILLPGLSGQDRIYLGIFWAAILVTLVYWPVALFRWYRNSKAG